MNRHNFFPKTQRPLVGKGLLFMEASRSLRKTTLGRTALEEWSVRRRDLYIITNNIHKRHISPRRDSKPQYQQVSGADPRLRRCGHRNLHPDIKPVRNGIQFYGVTVTSVGPGQCSRYSDSLRAEEFGIPTTVAGKKLYLLHPNQTDPVPPSLLYSAYRGCLSKVRRPGRDVDHPLLSNAM